MEPGSSLAHRNARISRPPFEISASYSWRNIWNKRDSCPSPACSHKSALHSQPLMVGRWGTGSDEQAVLYLKGRSPYSLLAFS